MFDSIYVEAVGWGRAVELFGYEGEYGESSNSIYAVDGDVFVASLIEERGGELGDLRGVEVRLTNSATDDSYLLSAETPYLVVEDQRASNWDIHVSSRGAANFALRIVSFGVPPNHRSGRCRICMGLAKAIAAAIVTAVLAGAIPPAVIGAATTFLGFLREFDENFGDFMQDLVRRGVNAVDAVAHWLCEQLGFCP